MYLEDESHSYHISTGSIVINKDGEFVTDTTLMKGYWYDFIFNFFKDSLAGVTFDVYAKEDIVSADGLDTVYHKAGDKVATIVTNDKGIARIDDLPLGKYYLVETKTIDGFVLDDTPIEADLSYIDQNTKVVFAGMDVTNERQKVQITVTKTDSETKEALGGAVFGLFAKEDIVNKDGKVKMAEVIGVSEAQLRFVTNTASGMGLIKCGSVVIPFDNQISKDTDLYRLYNTNIHEKIAEQKKKEAMLQ